MSDWFVLVLGIGDSYLFTGMERGGRRRGGGGEREKERERESY